MSVLRCGMLALPWDTQDLLLRCIASNCGAQAKLCVPHNSACGILVLQLGIKLSSPALWGRFLTTGPPGKSPLCLSIFFMPLNYTCQWQPFFPTQRTLLWFHLFDLLTIIGTGSSDLEMLSFLAFLVSLLFLLSCSISDFLPCGPSTRSLGTMEPQNPGLDSFLPHFLQGDLFHPQSLKPSVLGTLKFVSAALVSSLISRFMYLPTQLPPDFTIRLPHGYLSISVSTPNLVLLPSSPLKKWGHQLQLPIPNTYKSSLTSFPSLIQSKDKSSISPTLWHFICLCIYVWLCWVFVAVRVSSGFGKQGLLFVAVHGLLLEVGSLVAEHGL